MSGLTNGNFLRGANRARNQDDLIGFLEKNVDPSNIRKSCRWDEEFFSEQLEKGKYAKALQHLWESKKPPKDILSIGSNSFHAPILFECAVIAFQNAESSDDKLQTLKEVSWPLIGKGHFRTLQDAECSMDPSVKENADRLRGIYETRIKEEMKKSLGSDRQVFGVDCQTQVNDRVLEIAEASEFSTLPSPNWIGESGNWLQYKNVNWVPNSLGLSMKPQWTHDEIRRNYARKIVGSIHVKRMGQAGERMDES